MTCVNNAMIELYRGDCLIGRIEPKAELFDFPWHAGLFTPAPGFTEVEALFLEESRLLEAGEMDAWSDAWDAIEAPGLKLVPLDGGNAITELLIHIEDGVARWRC